MRTIFADGPSLEQLMPPFIGIPAAIILLAFALYTLWLVMLKGHTSEFQDMFAQMRHNRRERRRLRKYSKADAARMRKIYKQTREPRHIMTNINAR